ncbi:MAG TPA: fimbria/pilus outer membrane usher protein [Sphingomicrobium sp.]|nr:fimbria/pilus outer membrane usher protein [Sphingomicrobium sp.]
MKPSRTSFWSGASLLALLCAGPVAALAPQSDSAEAIAGLRDTLLSVSVNGARTGEPVALLAGPGGTFYASAAVLASWRLATPRPAFSRDGVDYYLLNAIPGLKLEFHQATQSLSLIARPETFERTRLSYAMLEPSDQVVGGTGGFLNYDVSAQVADGDTSLGGAFEAGIFTRFGVGISSFVGRWSNGGAELTRLDSNWTIDDPSRMRSLRLGDGNSRGGAGGVPFRFGGIQLARNFGVQPGFVTIPLPSLRGSAALPSVVDIYVNDALRGSRDVPPGPFEITDVPIVTGNGEVQLVVRDLLGRQMLYSQSYYAAQTLLRKGLHDYSYEAGFLRRSFGERSNDYGAMMVSATHRYGFSDRLTGEIHAEATTGVQSGGVAVGIVLPHVGHAEASLAASRSGRGTGAQAGLTLERRTRGLSLGARAEVSSKDYTSVGWDRDRRPPASTVQLFAGLPVRFGSLGLSYLRRDARGEPDAEYASASTTVRVARLGSLHLAGRKSLTGDKNLSAAVTWMVPVGPRASATAGAALNRGERTLTSSFQKHLPVGEGIGYRIATSVGTVERIDGRLSAQTGLGTHEAHLTWVDGQAGVRLSTAGGLGLVGGDAFAARRLSQSFAAVKVGDYPNVRVYADNQLVGRTGRDGTMIVPALRPFDRNALRIELADLPWDAEVVGDQLVVRPYDRHGVAVDFQVRTARAAILTILLDDGSALPAGSTVRLDPGPGEFVSAPGGEVYMTGLQSDNSAMASWSSGSCRFQFRFEPGDDPQPRLGRFRCRSIAR